MFAVPGILDGIPDEDVRKNCASLVVELQPITRNLPKARQQLLAGAAASLTKFNRSLSNQSLSPAKTRTQCLAVVSQWSEAWVGAFWGPPSHKPKYVIALIKQLCSKLISTLTSWGIPTQVRLLLSSTVLETLSPKSVPATSTDQHTIAARAWELYASDNDTVRSAGEVVLEALWEMCFTDKQMREELGRPSVPVEHYRAVLDVPLSDPALFSRFMSNMGQRWDLSMGKMKSQWAVWVDPFLHDKIDGKPFFQVFPELIPFALKHNVLSVVEHINDKTFPTSACVAFDAASGLGGTCLADTLQYMPSFRVQEYGRSPYVCVADRYRFSLMYMIEVLKLPILPAVQHCDLDAEMEEAVNYDIFASLLGKCVQQNNLGMLHVLTKACLKTYDKEGKSDKYLAQLMTVFELRHGGHGAGSSPHSLLSYAVWKGYDDVAKLLSAFMCDVFTRKMTLLKLPEPDGTEDTAKAIRERAALIEHVTIQCRKAIPHSHVVLLPQMDEVLDSIFRSLSNLFERQKTSLSTYKNYFSWLVSYVLPEVKAAKSIAAEGKLIDEETSSPFDGLIGYLHKPPSDVTPKDANDKILGLLKDVSQVIKSPESSSPPCHPCLVQHISGYVLPQRLRPKDAVNAWANAVLDIDAGQASNYGLNVFKWDGELLPHHVHYLMRIMIALWDKVEKATYSESTNPSEHPILKRLKSLWKRTRSDPQSSPSHLLNDFGVLVHELLVTACATRMHVSSSTDVAPWQKHVTRMVRSKKPEGKFKSLCQHIYDENTKEMYGSWWNNEQLDKAAHILLESTKDILTPFVSCKSIRDDTLHLLQLGTGGGKSKVIREMVEFLVKALPPTSISTAGTHAAPAWPADVQVQVDVITSSSLLAQRDAVGILEHLRAVPAYKNRYVVSLCGENAPVVRTFALSDDEDVVCMGITEALRGVAAEWRSYKNATAPPTLHFIKGDSEALIGELSGQRSIVELSLTLPLSKNKESKVPMSVIVITRNLQVSDSLQDKVKAALPSATISITSWTDAPHFVDIRVGDMASFMFSELKSDGRKSQSGDSGPETATPCPSANSRRICIVDEVDYNLIDCKTRDFRLSTTVHDDLTVTVLDKFLREMREHFPKPKQVATPAPSAAATDINAVAAPVVSSNLPVTAGKTAHIHGVSTPTSSPITTSTTTQATNPATGAAPPSTGRTPVGTVSHKNEVLAAALVHRYFLDPPSLSDINAAVNRIGASFVVADTLERDVDYVVDGLDLRIIDHSNHSFLPPNVVWNNLVHQIVQMEHDLPLTMPPVYKDKMKVPELINGYDLVIGLTATPGREDEYTEYRDGKAKIDPAAKLEMSKTEEPSSSASLPDVGKEGAMTPNSSQQDVHIGPVLVIANNDVSGEGVDNADIAATQVTPSPTSTLSPAKEESVRSSARTVAELLENVAARFPTREHNKAVLVICKTPKNALEMYGKFVEYNKDHNKFSVVTLFDRDSPDVTDTFRAFVALPGQVIIATPIAGRGVHIDPRAVDAPFTPPHGNAAEEGDGLDVIVAFDPGNDYLGERLKQQYEGRTRRLTSKGKFHIIDVETASQHGRSSVVKAQLTYLVTETTTTTSADVDFSAAVAASDVGGAASGSAARTIASSLKDATDRPWYSVEYASKPDRATVTLTNNINGFRRDFDKSQLYQSISLALRPLLDAIGPTILPDDTGVTPAADTDLAQAVAGHISSSTTPPTGDSSAFLELLHELYTRNHKVMDCEAHIFPTIIRYVYFSMDVNRTGFASKTIEQWRRGWAGSIGCDEILRFRDFPVYINDSVLLWVKKFQSGNPSAFPYEYGDLPHVLFDAMRWTSKNLGYGTVARYGNEYDLYHNPWKAPGNTKGLNKSKQQEVNAKSGLMNEFLNNEFHYFRSIPTMSPAQCASMNDIDPAAIFAKYRDVFSRCHALMCVPTKQLEKEKNGERDPPCAVPLTDAMANLDTFVQAFSTRFVLKQPGGRVAEDGHVLRESYVQHLKKKLLEHAVKINDEVADAQRLADEKLANNKSAVEEICKLITAIAHYPEILTMDNHLEIDKMYTDAQKKHIPCEDTRIFDDIWDRYNDLNKQLKESGIKLPVHCPEHLLHLIAHPCNAKRTRKEEKYDFLRFYIQCFKAEGDHIPKELVVTKRDLHGKAYFMDGECTITLFGHPHPTPHTLYINNRSLIDGPSMSIQHTPAPVPAPANPAGATHAP